MSKAGQIFKRLTPYNIKKGIRYLKHYGVRGFYARLLERFEEREVEYQECTRYNRSVSMNPPIVILLLPEESGAFFLWT